MTAKEYLCQARLLDMRIRAKIQQIERLYEVAVGWTAALSAGPRGSSRSESRTENCVLKIAEMQDELNDDVDALIERKKEIIAVIQAVEDPELQILLEKRYLCFLPWERIAAEMRFSVQHTFRLHGTALAEVTEILRGREQGVGSRQ